jgi:hypothetical protein
VGRAWKGKRPADARDGHRVPRDIEIVDMSDCTVLQRGESTLVFDKATGKPVFIRLPNMIQDPEILATIDDVCKISARDKLSVRVSQPLTSCPEVKYH